MKPTENLKLGLGGRTGKRTIRGVILSKEIYKSLEIIYS
jgi:hypothetical protein